MSTSHELEDQSLFILRDIRTDFIHLKSIYKDFDLVDRIILIRSMDDASIQFPIYIWHKNDHDPMLNHAMIQQIKQMITPYANVSMKEIENRLNLHAKNSDHMLIVPTIIESRFNGIICFEKNKQQDAWNNGEINLLKALSTTVAIFLISNNDREEYTQKAWVFSEVMNQMRTSIYVSDVKTDEILFMNEMMLEDFAIETAVGKKCWQVLKKGRTSRCENCPKDYLMHSEDENPYYAWEEYNELTNKYYKNYDSLMQWFDGEVVHFQHSVDVSENRKLYNAANFDELTGVYNRSKVKEMLTDTLVKAKSLSFPFTICMFDVNDLKLINDTYGHLEGDTLISMICEEIKKSLKKDDYIGRLSGDEFIVVYINCAVEVAYSKLQSALATLRKKNIYPDLERIQEFCFGAVQMNPKDNYTVKELLHLADEKLYAAKKIYHINSTEYHLTINGIKDSPVSKFSYNKDLLYEALVRSTDDYIYICNLKTGIFCYSQAMVDEFDLPGRIIENAAAIWGRKIHQNDKQMFLEANQEIIDGHTTSHNIEYRAKNHNDEWVWLRCRGNVMKNKEGENVLFAGFITNLGKRNKVDNITGLFNKYAIEDAIEHIYKNNPNEQFTLMLLNIDDFKRINALNNRVFGDGVIKLIAQKIQSLLQANQYIYRLDSDEFGIILRSEDSQEADELFEKIQTAFRDAQIYEDKNFYITLSCGCATAIIDAQNFQDLNKYADYALNQSKAKGKNRITHFCEEILIEKKRSLEVTEILRDSIENGFTGFDVYYQPIMSSRHELTGAEALARFYCRKYGNISPVEFIPLLEQNGLITKVGAWIFEQSVKACKRFSDQLPNFKMGINLSIKQLENMDFPAFIKATLEKYQLDHEHLVIELTESCIAQNVNELSKVLHDIRALKVTVSMDDFGTGYSSLGLLKNVPIDIVKIDRAFVKEIKENVFDHAFINLVVELCKILNIETLLEGVEQEDEFEIASRFSLNYYQGFLFGYPINEDEFYETYIKKKDEANE